MRCPRLGRFGVDRSPVAFRDDLHVLWRNALADQFIRNSIRPLQRHFEIHRFTLRRIECPNAHARMPNDPHASTHLPEHIGYGLEYGAVLRRHSCRAIAEIDCSNP